MTTGGLSRALMLACAITALAAAPAVAQRCVAPPGTAAIEQYCETIPSASGPRGPDTGGAATLPVPAATQRELDDSGATGQELNQVLRGAATPAPAKAKADAPAVGKPTTRGRAGDTPDRGTAAPPARPTPAATPASTGNPLSAVRSALTGTETVGSGFPWVLLAIATAVGGVGWLRRSRHGSG